MAQASIWAFSNGFLADLDPRRRPSRLVQTTYQSYSVVAECYDMMRKVQLVVWQGYAFRFFCQVRIVVVGLDNSGFELSTVKEKIAFDIIVIQCCDVYVSTLTYAGHRHRQNYGPKCLEAQESVFGNCHSLRA